MYDNPPYQTSASVVLGFVNHPLSMQYAYLARDQLNTNTCNVCHTTTSWSMIRACLRRITHQPVRACPPWAAPLGAAL